MDKNTIDSIIAKVKAAQEQYANFTQEQVDNIVFHAAIAANHNRIYLAKLAVEETGMGVMEDKVIKNHFAAEFIFDKYRDEKTCGVISKDPIWGIYKVADSVGVIAGIIPTTNPTSTVIFKTLLALKTRNGIIFNPHPRAKKCSVATAKIMLEAAVAAGAPADIIGWIDEPTIETTNAVMFHKDIAIILATGGPGMVKAAYSCGKPAIGVGAGNTPAVIDETADIPMTVSSILLSKTFDNGVICASEQSVVVVKEIYASIKKEFLTQGAYFLNDDEKNKLAKALIIDGKLNPQVVGQTANKIAALAGFNVPEYTKILIAEVEKIGIEEPFSYEKLSPVLAFYTVDNFTTAADYAEKLIEFGGLGHTAVLYTNEINEDRIEYYGKKVKTARILINMPSSHGAIGGIYNFRLEPSLTLGCGVYGGNSTAENISLKHLLNVKTIAERRENTLCFATSPKIYFKPGCLAKTLLTLEGFKRAYVIIDSNVYDLDYIKTITEIFNSIKIQFEFFPKTEQDPNLNTIKEILLHIRSFNPDIIFAIGGGSTLDCGKITWLLFDHQDIEFDDLKMRFLDITKRIYRIPKTRNRTTFVAIPTTSGSGSEVTPFAIINDVNNKTKIPISDNSIIPDIAIIDPAIVYKMPPNITANSGFDAISHALEAMVAVTASDYSNALATEALRILFKYLPISFKEGETNVQAREKVHNAATMAGIAYANAYLGLAHSFAHKLEGVFNISHGILNAIVLPHVINFNATRSPTKFTAFPQYKTPDAIERYARIATIIGFHTGTLEGNVAALIKNIETLRTELNLPACISETGVSKEDYEAKITDLAELIFDDQCTATNPRYPLIAEIHDILTKIYDCKSAI